MGNNLLFISTCGPGQGLDQLLEDVHSLLMPPPMSLHNQGRIPSARHASLYLASFCWCLMTRAYPGSVAALWTVCACRLLTTDTSIAAWRPPMKLGTMKSAGLLSVLGSRALSSSVGARWALAAVAKIASLKWLWRAMIVWLPHTSEFLNSESWRCSPSAEHGTTVSQSQLWGKLSDASLVWSSTSSADSTSLSQTITSILRLSSFWVTATTHSTVRGSFKLRWLDRLARAYLVVADGGTDRASVKLTYIHEEESSGGLVGFVCLVCNCDSWAGFSSHLSHLMNTYMFFHLFTCSIHVRENTCIQCYWRRSHGRRERKFIHV